MCAHAAFEIRKTKESDIDQIMELYDQAKKFMIQQGNPHQWEDEEYLTRDLIEADQTAGDSYVCVQKLELQKEQIVGTFVYFQGEEPTYGKIWQGAWPNQEPYGVVHRLATREEVKGVGTFCMEWALKQGANLRVDTHEDNIPMLSLLKKLGFQYCGKVMMLDDTERKAFYHEKNN